MLTEGSKQYQRAVRFIYVDMKIYRPSYYLLFEHLIFAQACDLWSIQSKVKVTNIKANK